MARLSDRDKRVKRFSEWEGSGDRSKTVTKHTNPHAMGGEAQDSSKINWNEGSLGPPPHHNLLPSSR